MFSRDNQIKIKTSTLSFLKLIKKYNEKDIECTKHTFFRLNEKQREIFTCKELKRILREEKPFLVGIQYNENHALFYRYQDKILKIILNLNRKVNIVTFYFIKEWQIPQI